MAKTEFDPIRDVKVRGRSLDKLSRDELLEALIQALWRLHELEQPARQDAYRPVPRPVAAMPRSIG